ncbi:MAG: hypothetical protein ABS81_04225 [Pseudonocardia sp. SCN 72-86]|nr:MAG: hypothetical protein ABS81_04225 [Pseudonocardia sp. SCN 72-86]
MLGCIGAFLAAAPVLAACGSGGTAASGGGAGKTVGVSLNGINDYTKYVAEGIAKALDGGGYQLKIVQANFDGPTELRNLENLASQGVAAIVCLPNTIETTLNGIREAKDAGIPNSLAIWAGPGPVDPYTNGVAFVDSAKGGVMTGEWLKKNATPGKIIVVQGIVGQGFTERLDQGLDQSLAGTGFQVVVREQGMFDRNTAVGVVERGLQAHPDAKIIVSHAAAMGDGIASYLKQNNITDVVHVSDDVDDELLTWLGTPYMQVSRFYSPGETGLIAGRIVRTALEGGNVQFQNDVFQDMMTVDNKDQFLKDHPYRYREFASTLNL